MAPSTFGTTKPATAFRANKRPPSQVRVAGRVRRSCGVLRLWRRGLTPLASLGSLDSEAGIFGMAFDKSYSRLITAEADKTIKMYREDPDSVSDGRV
jgi:hypothetical protein